MVVSPVLALGLAAVLQADVPPVPSLAPRRRGEGDVAYDAGFDEPIAEVYAEASTLPPAMPSEPDTGNSVAAQNRDTTLSGQLSQGGLIQGSTTPETQVLLDGEEVMVDPRGNFVFGFGRDHPTEAEITIITPDGERETRTVSVLAQDWRESRVTVQENKANPFDPADLEKIARDRELKDAARRRMGNEAYWVSGFSWPAEGCISSPFGYRRIVNGEPRRYHSGVDVAAPDGMSPLDYIGTPVYAPAAGQVTLSEPDMFFEGGLVFIDHGQRLETALMHMDTVVVEQGDFVQQGDIVGTVGRTGRVTGPHLHWSLKWTDRLLDPTLSVDDRPVCTD